MRDAAKRPPRHTLLPHTLPRTPAHHTHATHWPVRTLPASQAWRHMRPRCTRVIRRPFKPLPERLERLSDRSGLQIPPAFAVYVRTHAPPCETHTVYIGRAYLTGRGVCVYGAPLPVQAVRHTRAVSYMEEQGGVRVCNGAGPLTSSRPTRLGKPSNSSCSCA